MTIIHPNPILYKECIAYRRGMFDTHGGMGSNEEFTIPLTDTYLIKTATIWRKVDLKAGDVIRDVQEIMNIGCPGYKQSIRALGFEV